MARGGDGPLCPPMHPHCAPDPHSHVRCPAPYIPMLPCWGESCWGWRSMSSGSPRLPTPSPRCTPVPGQMQGSGGGPRGLALCTPHPPGSGSEGELVLLCGLLHPGAQPRLDEGSEQTCLGSLVLLRCQLGLVVCSGLSDLGAQQVGGNL